VLDALTGPKAISLDGGMQLPAKAGVLKGCAYEGLNATRSHNCVAMGYPWPCYVNDFIGFVGVGGPMTARQAGSGRWSVIWNGLDVCPDGRRLWRHAVQPAAAAIVERRSKPTRE
jgi:hypothetical protein